jgi:hypothetical protein
VPLHSDFDRLVGAGHGCLDWSARPVQRVTITVRGYLGSCALLSCSNDPLVLDAVDRGELRTERWPPRSLSHGSARAVSCDGSLSPALSTG